MFDSLGKTVSILSATTKLNVFNLKRILIQSYSNSETNTLSQKECEVEIKLDATEEG